MNIGDVYLVQPAILIGTSRYKIGCSEHYSNRIKNYGKATKKLRVFKCFHPYLLEARIKRILKKKFRPVTGQEWFEGNEQSIISEFDNEVIKYLLEYKE